MSKNCTDIEQSQKLIELGIDVNTADMMWDDWSLIDEGWKLSVGYYPEIEKDYGRKCYPAWSLSALLSVIPQEIFDGEYIINITEGLDDKWILTYDHCENRYHSYYGLSSGADNLVDACVAMIEKLYKRKML